MADVKYRRLYSSWGWGRYNVTSTSRFEMFHVCLGVLCRHHLFQRKKRSVSIKKKRSRKSLSKIKAKPLNFLALKKTPAKKFVPKKKRPMPGYQATAPARPRGDFRVKLLSKEAQTPSRSSYLEEKIFDGRPRAPCPPLCRSSRVFSQLQRVSS